MRFLMQADRSGKVIEYVEIPHGIKDLVTRAATDEDRARFGVEYAEFRASRPEVNPLPGEEAKFKSPEFKEFAKALGEPQLAEEPEVTPSQRSGTRKDRK